MFLTLAKSGNLKRIGRINSSFAGRETQMHEKANEIGSNTHKGGLLHPDAKHGLETGGKIGWQELNVRLRSRVGE